MANTRFHTDTALADGLRELFTQLEQRLCLQRPLNVYLAGGMAVHLYTGKRVTDDVDAEFAGRVLLPSDLVVEVANAEGSTNLIYFDTHYNPMFSLLHEDYQEDAIQLPLGLTQLRVFVLTPLDLAVSKLARFADNDQEDIQDLVRLGLTTADAIEQRASSALVAYVGNPAVVSCNLRDAIAQARMIEMIEQASAGKSKLACSGGPTR
ncbi:MAG: hypothetical protein COS34_11200 [Lysobacterales bacterium CG02_land_8_20_14_3_00_62_12]|nr:MAG: hypothetical protein COS34_11200 [Xanthomonadales bacterium CG02_land_8_20_14_3_00_62_12]